MENSDIRYPALQNTKDSQNLFRTKNICDRYDYLVAVACGVVGGLIDIFMVGTPGSSVLGSWTDSQVDNAVMAFSRKMGWKPRAGNENNIRSAIGFLENGSISSGFHGFKVNYDQAKSPDVNNLFKIAPKNHHMMSLAHSPDIVGLFFSVLNQFTSTSTFIANGKFITIATDTYELQGNNFISRLFCGVTNWFGHLMSDIAGSSGATGRGSGIVIPFYELFGLCNFGKFRVGKDKQDLAVIATRAFQEGYDLRFGMTQAIPVIITDLLIRLVWSLRKYFQYKKPIKECIPSSKYDDLRIMILLGTGSLCALDGVDAVIRSGGNFLLFFTRFNLIAWFYFTTLALKEVFIRIGVKDSLQASIDAYKRIDEVILIYLKELEQIDIVRFKQETEKYSHITHIFMYAKSEEELNVMLLDIFERMGIHKPWEGDFDKHMANKNGTLVFQ